MNLKDKLKNDIEECSWSLLENNVERGAVFIISNGLELIDVGLAIAEDQSQTVSNWLKNEQIINIKLEDSGKYKEKQFQFLIIQPYVLVKVKLK